MSAYPPRRPGILGPISFVSFLLSFLNIVWIIVFGLLVAAAGAAGWLLGPVVGVVGSFVAVLFFLILVLQSLLSVLLFFAALKTWSGQPSGRTLHLTWAWITLVLDLLDLAFTAGLDGGAWVRLVYAAVVIYVMNRDDVRDYFDPRPSDPFFAKKGRPDDWV